jgi:hypothetical protein
MQPYTLSASRRVNAPAKNVYAVIADYHNGHPHILPKRHFSDLQVEKGGVGAGTLIRFSMTVMGTTRTSRASISEPEPGRVLVETVLDSDIVTSFIVDPTADGTSCDVTISTALQSRDGIAGAIGRFTTRRLLLRIYREELRLIAEFAKKQI